MTVTMKARPKAPKVICRLKNCDAPDTHADVAVKTGRPVQSFGYVSMHFGMHELLMHNAIGIAGFWTGVQPVPPQQAHKHWSLCVVFTHRAVKQISANIRAVVNFILLKKQGELCYNSDVYEHECINSQGERLEVLAVWIVCFVSMVIILFHTLPYMSRALKR